MNTKGDIILHYYMTFDDHVQGNARNVRTQCPQGVGVLSEIHDLQSKLSVKVFHVKYTLPSVLFSLYREVTDQELQTYYWACLHSLEFVFHLEFYYEKRNEFQTASDKLDVYLKKKKKTFTPNFVFCFVFVFC